MKFQAGDSEIQQYEAKTQFHLSSLQNCPFVGNVFLGSTHIPSYVIRSFIECIFINKPHCTYLYRQNTKFQNEYGFSFSFTFSKF